LFLFCFFVGKKNKTKTNNSEETSKIKGNFRNINKSRETLQGSLWNKKQKNKQLKKKLHFLKFYSDKKKKTKKNKNKKQEKGEEVSVL
jgi:hypothetical protein